MKKLRFFLLALISLTLLVVYWQRQTIERLRNEIGILRERASEPEQLQSAYTGLAESEGGSDELARLRKEHSELLRLRGETAVLREQLKSMAGIPKNREETMPPVPQAPVETFTAIVESELAPRQTLVLGGWPTAEGKRTYLLVEPTLMDAAGNAVTPEQASEKTGTAQIHLQTRFVEVPEELLQNLGLKNVVSEGNQSSSQLTLTKEQSELLLRNLGETAGVNILGAPRVITANGVQANVSVTEEKSIDNQIYSLGPTVSVLPQVSPDGRLIKLSIDATTTRESLRK